MSKRKESQQTVNHDDAIGILAYAFRQYEQGYPDGREKVMRLLDSVHATFPVPEVKEEDEE